MVGTILNQNKARATTTQTRLTDLFAPIAADLDRVEKRLGEQVDCFDERIRRHISYVLSGHGKRLRPSLALLSAGSTGAITDAHITLGVIVEMIHISTLVHDDVLDDASLRHGLPTANAKWGNEISVLVGDCLFARALHLATDLPGSDVSRRISEATNTVCAGEILQTQRRFDLDLSIPEYLDIVRMKTGALFAVSCELGASLNAAPNDGVQYLKQFGEKLGIAYQIFDDCVDLFGQERVAGKSLGTDINKGKLTLPYLLLLGHADPERRKLFGALMLQGGPQARMELNQLILSNGVVDELLSTIKRFIEEARSCLESLPASHYTDAMAALLLYFSDQSQALPPR